MNRRVTSLMMERLGYQLNTVNNGAEAFAAVRARTFSLVLMDIEMPRMTGIEATRCIYGYFLGAVERPYIVALTASADEASCRHAGMDSYLRKPIGLTDLCDTITKGLTEVYRRRAKPTPWTPRETP